MSLPNINQEYFTDFLVKLLNIASPTGFVEPAIAFVEKELSQYKQLELLRTRKGDRKSTRLNSSHIQKSRMPSSA